jgi:large subunit ribosomal protein L30
MKPKLKVVQLRSGIGRSEHQNKVLMGLGLNGPNCVVIVDNTPSFRGMIKKILHLVTVEESDA